jgi:hypothetical protein
MRANPSTSSHHRLTPSAAGFHRSNFTPHLPSVAKFPRNGLGSEGQDRGVRAGGIRMPGARVAGAGWGPNGKPTCRINRWAFHHSDFFRRRNRRDLSVAVIGRSPSNGRPIGPGSKSCGSLQTLHFPIGFPNWFSPLRDRASPQRRQTSVNGGLRGILGRRSLDGWRSINGEI